MVVDTDPSSPDEELVATPFDEDRVDIYFGRMAEGGGSVYLAILLLLGLAAAALPLIQLPIAIRAQGFLRASADPQVLYSVGGGTVTRVLPREVRAVEAGDTIALLDRPELRARARALGARRRVLEAERLDLLRLIGQGGSPTSAPLHPLSVRYREDWGTFRLEAEGIEQRIEVEQRRAERVNLLLRGALVSVADADDARSRAAETRLERALHRNRALARWRNEVATSEEALRILAAEEEALAAEVERLAVISPVAGILDDLSALSEGSVLRAGERVATITPESELIAEVYVPAEQLSAVVVETQVRLQLESHRFSEWGTLEGQIFEISPDLTSVGSQQVGWVRVRPERVTAAGSRGQIPLRRGMAVSAWIRGTPRSLWALLRSRSALQPAPPDNSAAPPLEISG